MLPKTLRSPSWMVHHQKGNSFEYASFLVSILLGQGYNAFVVSGYAAKEIVQCDTSNFDSPYVIESDDISPHAGVETDHSNVYKFKPPPDFKSRFLLQQKQKQEELEEEELRQQQLLQQIEVKRDVHNSKIDVVDKYHGFRIHAWVVLLPESNGPKHDEIKEPIFLEPSSGIVNELNTANVNRYYLGIESIWNDQNYWVNMQLNCSCDNLRWDLTKIDDWEYLLSGEIAINHTDKFNDSENTNVISEKHLDMPISYVKEIKISYADYERRYPNSVKIMDFKKCRVTLYSPYSQETGLVEHVVEYEDQKYEKEIYARQKYIYRTDRLIKIKQNWILNRVIEYFDLGRLDACKEYQYELFSKTSATEEKVIKFYDYIRSDGLCSLTINRLNLLQEYKNRSDLLKSRFVEFAAEWIDVQKTEIRISIIIDIFERNENIDASKDIQIREMDFKNNKIRLKYFFEEGYYTRAYRVYKTDISFDEQSIIFDPNMSWEFHPKESLTPRQTLDLYMDFNKLITIKNMILNEIFNSQSMISKFIKTRISENEFPKLLRSLFKRSQIILNESLF